MDVCIHLTDATDDPGSGAILCHPSPSRRWVLPDTSREWMLLDAMLIGGSVPAPVIVIGDRERPHKRHQQVMIRTLGILAGAVLALAIMLMWVLIPALREVLPSLLRVILA